MEQPTKAALRDRTAVLVKECPEWCTETHAPDTHPEDLVHRCTVGRTEWGAIVLNVWPVPIGEHSTKELYLEGLDVSLSFEQAEKLSGTLMRATDQLRMAVFGRDGQITAAVMA